MRGGKCSLARLSIGLGLVLFSDTKIFVWVRGRGKVFPDEILGKSQIVRIDVDANGKLSCRTVP